VTNKSFPRMPHVPLLIRPFDRLPHVRYGAEALTEEGMPREPL
jgi:hypothetical protein